LAYSGMMAKELSALSGIKKHTPDLRLLVDTAEQLSPKGPERAGGRGAGLDQKWT
jgi:hypothetical protein